MAMCLFMNAPAGGGGFPLSGRKSGWRGFEARTPPQASTGPTWSYAFISPGGRLFKNAHNRKRDRPVLIRQCAHDSGVDRAGGGNPEL